MKLFLKIQSYCKSHLVQAPAAFKCLNTDLNPTCGVVRYKAGEGEEQLRSTTVRDRRPQAMLQLTLKNTESLQQDNIPGLQIEVQLVFFIKYSQMRSKTPSKDVALKTTQNILVISQTESLQYTTVRKIPHIASVKDAPRNSSGTNIINTKYPSYRLVVWKSIMIQPSECQKEIAGLIGELIRPKECSGLGWDWATVIKVSEYQRAAVKL
ncbi:uncharacterized protein LOC128784260 isoform X2 [Vidua chalybeata]|uniref:uncharacterized protein LOC128784260 isoform X2 n=1 Tax=Vidua chalybeata TaxID=81927 RepID=UPI0023A7D3F2|nr:uncharacterized protein LOC128784260 isoform X2 [Vidua chalybeata]